MMPAGEHFQPVIPPARMKADADGALREYPLKFLRALIQEQGDSALYTSTYGPIYFFNHPDQVQAVLQNSRFERTTLLTLLLGNGLLASEGPYWRSQRKLMQPHFHEGCLKGFAALITETVSQAMRRWERPAQTSTPILLDVELRLLTLEIILRVIFGEVTQDEVQTISEAMRTLMEDLGDFCDGVFNLPVRFTPQRNAQFRTALRALDEVVAQKIQARRSAPNRGHDLLGTLLNAEAGPEDTALKPQQVRDEVVNLLVAGHETTAISLTWALHLLERNPEAAQRLDQELETMLGDRVPTLDDLPKLEYTRMVFEEAMRLYPPVSVSARRSAVVEQVGGTTVPAKGIVLISAYTTHRHPQFWSNPEEFDPERFSAQRSEKRHRFAYFPFLGGRHQCLGQPLAMMEGKLILAMVARQFAVHPLPGHPREPTPGAALRLREGFPVRLEQRRSSVCH